MRPLLKLFLLGLSLVALTDSEVGAQAPGPGVPRELARWRAEHYRDVRYLLDLTLGEGAERLEGRLKVTVTLDAAAGDLVLDWRSMKRDEDVRSRVGNVRANGRAVSDVRFVNEHVVVPRAYLKAGVNEVELEFESPIGTAGSAVTRYLDREDNSEYVYTLFVPSDASTAFPCFDQPDLKARFKLTVTAPDGWKVISNTHHTDRWVSECVPGGACPPQKVAFAETEPLSTYQFAFAAGPFEVLEVQREAVLHAYPLDPKTGRISPVHQRRAAQRPPDDEPRTSLFVRRSKRARAEKELAEVVRINREGVRFFEEYFAHKFPFSKYDLILIPEFAYGGMEHAGATFLREEGVLFPSDPTAADLAARAEVILHEAAHQWFGDLVTMRWFDDLWLKEGFATFMAYKAFERVMPRLDAWKVFHLRTKPLAYLTDVTKGTTPIWQEIANLSAAKSAYGNIVYRKAPSMLRQAEFYLGEREFRDAVRLVIKEHAYGNATWEDLVGAFERTSGRRLGAWADAWVKRRGMPDVRVRLVADGRGRIASLSFEQKDALGEGGSWPMRLSVALAYLPKAGGSADFYDLHEVLLDGARPARVPEVVGKPRPDFVFANFKDYGYGRFLLDDASRAFVVQNLGRIREDFLRALLWGSLWESVREAELAPADFVELAVKHAPAERDDVMLAFVLARAQTAFTRYLPDARQKALAPRLEGLLREGMLNAPKPGQRITYFRTYREVATTPAALGDLNDILEGRLRVPGMTLRSRDRFDIIRALVAAGGGRGQELLKKEGEADKTDDARRYAYAAAAAAPDASVKTRYFGQFVGDRELAESWIEAAFGPFNTPQQSALTLPFLEPALAELPTLKRTRKIFFVNGWLAAFIGGQCDARAVATVRDFLARERTLDRDLRLKVLEAADGLERCVRIRARFAAEPPDSAPRAP